jgi:spermidine dehydrogenase
LNEGITRRQFIDGLAVGVAAAAVPGALRAQAGPADPPSRGGEGGGRPQDYAVAHAVRDGRRYSIDSQPVAERYDVVVVGAGIGGLATAYYLRRKNRHARILILDAQDDFGGHARRNEFNVDGRSLLGYGGSESLDGPRKRWSKAARECIRDLGVNLDRLERGFLVDLYPALGLSFGQFFGREAFGVDRLVTGDPVRILPSEIPAARARARMPEQFIADFPLDDAQKARLLAVYDSRRDVLGGLPAARKQELLDSISYIEYLKRYFDLRESEFPMFFGRTFDPFATRADFVPASWAMGCGLPGFAGLGIGVQEEFREANDPYIDHFPDGNATLARLFVRALVAGVAPGHTMDDIVEAPFDYSRLDAAGSAVRVRLSSTVVALRNTAGGVDLLYDRGGTVTHVAAGHAVWAGYSAMLPYVAPELKEGVRKAHAQQLRAPLVYVNVALRNWRAWVARGVHTVSNPAGFYSDLKLDFPVNIGNYRCPTHPDEPILLHLIHVPWPQAAMPDLAATYRAARTQLYARSFAEFEFHARDELTRILGPGGFDATRDISAITVNRWGHGYALEENSLFDGEDFERNFERARGRVGRIHFAGTDTTAQAYAHSAIDSALRAASEIYGA